MSTNTEEMLSKRLFLSNDIKIPRNYLSKLPSGLRLLGIHRTTNNSINVPDVFYLFHQLLGLRHMFGLKYVALQTYVSLFDSPRYVNCLVITESL